MKKGRHTLVCKGATRREEEKMYSLIDLYQVIYKAGRNNEELSRGLSGWDMCPLQMNGSKARDGAGIISNSNAPF